MDSMIKMKKATFYFLIILLSFTAAIEVSICLFIPGMKFDAGLAGGAVAGGMAFVALLVTAASFALLITASLILDLLIDKRKVVRLYLMLNIIILPAWGIMQYGSEPVTDQTPNSGIVSPPNV